MEQSRKSLHHKSSCGTVGGGILLRTDKSQGRVQGTAGSHGDKARSMHTEQMQQQSSTPGRTEQRSSRAREAAGSRAAEKATEQSSTESREARGARITHLEGGFFVTCGPADPTWRSSLARAARRTCDQPHVRHLAPRSDEQACPWQPRDSSHRVQGHV